LAFITGRERFPMKACVFDAYGTLFDVHSAVRRHGARCGAEAEALSALWRQKQLEYTWTRSLMRRHADFRAVTAEALDHALAVHGKDDPALRAALLDAYLALDAYPEVPETLRRLKRAGVATAVLSNGSPAMLDAAIEAAGIGGLLDAVYSVECVGIYKPDPRVYALAVDGLGVPKDRIWFQSSNVWDAAAAGVFGFNVVWCNRARQRREYAWAFDPVEVESLAALPDLVAAAA
jgi:2-haloacid dehalogenase